MGKKNPEKGVCFLPKRNLNILKCEVQRALKLTSNSVEAVSFTIPRKSDRFQADLFPDCYAGVAAMTADEYFGGKNANPPLISLDPAKGGKVSAGEASTKKARMSYIQMESENKCSCNKHNQLCLLTNCQDTELQKLKKIALVKFSTV